MFLLLSSLQSQKATFLTTMMISFSHYPFNKIPKKFKRILPPDGVLGVISKQIFLLLIKLYKMKPTLNQGLHDNAV